MRPGADSHRPAASLVRIRSLGASSHAVQAAPAQCGDSVDIPVQKRARPGRVVRPILGWNPSSAGSHEPGGMATARTPAAPAAEVRLTDLASLRVIGRCFPLAWVKPALSATDRASRRLRLRPAHVSPRRPGPGAPEPHRYTHPTLADGIGNTYTHMQFT